MKIGFLITARLKSTRLPLKLLLDLNGKSIVERVIERTKKVAFVEDIVLCTSTNPQDKPLVDIAVNNGIYYYLGSEEDVLQRLSNAAKFFGFDYVVNVTGENPLFSIRHANLVANALRENQHDFVYLDGLPIGCAVYGLNAKALDVICKVKEVMDTEIWGVLINRPKIFDVRKIEVNDGYAMPNVRITSDYIEDYQFISKIYSHFPADYCPSYEEIFYIIKEKPELLKIHENRVQASLPKEFVEKVDKYFEENHDEIVALKKELYK